MWAVWSCLAGHCALPCTALVMVCSVETTRSQDGAVGNLSVVWGRRVHSFRWITLEQRIFQLKNTFCHFAKISGLDTQLTHHTFSFFIFLFFFFFQRIDAQIPVYFSRRVVAIVHDKLVRGTKKIINQFVGLCRSAQIISDGNMKGNGAEVMQQLTLTQIV